MLLQTGYFTLFVTWLYVNELSAKTFRLVTSLQYGDVTLCSVNQPYKVLSVSDIMLPMSGLTPGIPPHVLCSQGCTGEQDCTGFNYKQDVGQCQLYNNIATNCTVQQACSHYSTNWMYACQEILYYACNVSALSWGLSDTQRRNGYVRVNEKTTNKTTIGRGFNIVELDVSKCAMSDVRNFDTHGFNSESIDMANYINSLPTLTVLIGVTADSASGKLEINGRTALLSIGVNVTELQYRGKVAFVAQVGRPVLAVMKMGPEGGENVKIAVNLKGSMLSTNIIPLP